MSKKYYEMKVLIKGVVRVPMNDYEDREYAIECVEMTDDIVDIAENIQRNNDKEFYVNVNKRTVKEVGVD
ncbi:hypothetical protein EXM90_19055 [Clostridium botulinum]|uniref:hypothetical protein n=1 Tax=Clostridium botulinum TaxID=1491 RepID=UPI0004654A73|nr:hypothetical protein [Clostridium botulinum]APR02362.1 hypothetical protein RSJ2_3963 [Clostridium botulinum]AUN01484.1 hypothetical protein RSJ19_00435 [Clostridium botulinum]MBN3352076.1 hypothetical protein [Clostridium botulinum]MBN3367036.1 hypothetical protein [Clostridium botulinum]MBN3371672.1 hypothetical protein [Clostridium botulinum]